MEEIRRLVANTHHEAKLIIEDSRLKSEQMLYETQQTIDDMIERKNLIEIRLKEFISAEKELIKKYESDEE